jgi:indolepyruvate ferredoxin oxidoreductase beta subunit
MSQRGGSVVTYVRYGEKVYEPIVEVGQADILIAFERLEALRYIHYLKADGVLIVNDQRMDPMTVVTGMAEYPEDIIERLKAKGRKVVVTDAMGEAQKLGNARVFNTIVIGLAARRMDFKKEDWLKVIAETVPAKTVELNLKAFEAGYCQAG